MGLLDALELVTRADSNATAAQLAAHPMKELHLLQEDSMQTMAAGDVSFTSSAAQRSVTEGEVDSAVPGTLRDEEREAPQGQAAAAAPRPGPPAATASANGALGQQHGAGLDRLSTIGEASPAVPSSLPGPSRTPPQAIPAAGQRDSHAGAVATPMDSGVSWRQGQEMLPPSPFGAPMISGSLGSISSVMMATGSGRVPSATGHGGGDRKPRGAGGSSFKSFLGAAHSLLAAPADALEAGFTKVTSASRQPGAGGLPCPCRMHVWCTTTLHRSACRRPAAQGAGRADDRGGFLRARRGRGQRIHHQPHRDVHVH